MTPQELEAEALKLDAASRAKLAASIWDSLGEPYDEEWVKERGAEALRRDAEMDADPSASIPADEVMREIRSMVEERSSIK